LTNRVIERLISIPEISSKTIQTEVVVVVAMVAEIAIDSNRVEETQGVSMVHSHRHQINREVST
jgi:hypothetical protein